MPTESDTDGSPHTLARAVDDATERLIRTASLLSDADVRQPSALPGWTRGHVLTHVARNADSLVNLLTWARTGVETPQYPSAEIRDADIARGAPRDAASQVRDLVESAARLAAAVAAMSASSWATRVRWRNGDERPAADIPWARLVELEVHHADLAAGYAAADSPPWFTARFLAELAESFGRRPGVPPMLVRAEDTGAEYPIGDPPATVTVTGTGPRLTSWLSGRSTGADLVTSPDGTVPPLPMWK